jgi:hypothetical protein
VVVVDLLQMQAVVVVVAESAPWAMVGAVVEELLV